MPPLKRCTSILKGETKMNYKPSVEVDKKWNENSLVFATEEEALTSARDLMQRWVLVTGYRAVPSEDAVNYKIVDSVLSHV